MDKEITAESLEAKPVEIKPIVKEWTAKIIDKGEVDQAGNIEVTVQIFNGETLKYDRVHLIAPPEQIVDVIKQKGSGLKEQVSKSDLVQIGQIIEL